MRPSSLSRGIAQQAVFVFAFRAGRVCRKEVKGLSQLLLAV